MDDNADHARTNLTNQRRSLLKAMPLGLTGVASGCLNDSDSSTDTPTETPPQTPSATPEPAQTGRFTEPRRWLGPEHWANPLQDWRRHPDGRIERDRGTEPGNLHRLTESLADDAVPFESSVRIGGVTDGDGNPSAGFRILPNDPHVDDYRHRVFATEGNQGGIPIRLTAEGAVTIGEVGEWTSSESSLPAADAVDLTLSGAPADGQYELTIEATPAGDDSTTVSASKQYDPSAVTGGLALWTQPGNGGPIWIEDWTTGGEKITEHPDRTFGPVLFTQYTVDAGTVRLTAQFPPLGPNAGSATLELETDDGWRAVDTAPIDDLARTARFELTDRTLTEDQGYRVVYEHRHPDDDGPTVHSYEGTLRTAPDEGEAVVCGTLSCQVETAFPYAPVAEGLATHDPDILFFTGDQFYESHNGHAHAPPNAPLEHSSLDYLRKWYMFGAAFGDVMADRPTVSMPDDHDVFQGNLWGEGGEALPQGKRYGFGGYQMPPEWVNMVERTQTSHLPAPHDPEPVAQGIGVYYTSIDYGGISFAITEDRKWKSGPGPVEDVWEGDHPDLTLLGDRQLAFLEEWGQDWDGVDMKIAVSQSTLSGVPTHARNPLKPYRGSADSNGWPPAGRNRAVRALAEANAFHLGGDQHLPMVLQYGIEEFGDGPFNFTCPAISTGFMRGFFPDEVSDERAQKLGPVDHDHEYAGQYRDQHDHPISLYAVNNPASKDPQDDNILQKQHKKASGYGILRLDREAAEITIESWPFLSDPTGGASEQMDGWPITIDAPQPSDES
jgi:phosphodiesterase/alkaline phosphatase D-like protein